MTQFPPMSPAPADALANKTSGMAVAAMILGILGLLTGCIGIGILLGLVGLILGIIAAIQIGQPGKPGRGKGMAITGIVTGAMSALATLLIAPLLIGIMLPALGAARTTARQIQSSTQARGIHQASVTYAQLHNQQMSNDIGELTVSNYFTVDYVLSPFGTVTEPAGFMNWPQDQQVQWVRQNASYVLVPNLTDDLDYNTIAIFGNPADFGGRGIPVTRNDNTTAWETNISDVETLLLQQTGMSMQELIDRQKNMTGPVSP